MPAQSAGLCKHRLLLTHRAAFPPLVVRVAGTSPSWGLRSIFPDSGFKEGIRTVQRAADGPQATSLGVCKATAALAPIWQQALPNPQRQAELMLLALGNSDLAFGEYVHWRSERFCAEIGTQDDPAIGTTRGLDLIAKRLEDKGLLEADKYPPAPNRGYRLTFDGWAEYGRLRRTTAESKTAFMAMSFSNPTLDAIVSDCFVPAVRETGFDLFRLDDRPKAGLIDNRMRVEIRAAKFLVCDLTDENRGAYWEAGFAEGALKPVFYTCEKTKFQSAKSHFDTEHLFTVKWDKSDPGKAAEELKAAIRNEFPAEAVQTDLRGE